MKQTNLIFAGALAAIVTNAALAEGQNIVTSRAYVDSAVATKQPVLSGQSNTNYAVTYPTSTGGTPSSRLINESMGSSTSDTGLATTGAINTALNGKQQNINGTANTVVTYTGTSGGTGSKAVYSSGSAYSGQTGNLTEAQHVNSAVTNGFNAHLTCKNSPDCTLYDVNTLSGTYVPQPAQGN